MDKVKSCTIHFTEEYTKLAGISAVTFNDVIFAESTLQGVKVKTHSLTNPAEHVVYNYPIHVVSRCKRVLCDSDE